MDDWTLAYDAYDPSQEGLREALCVLGNGHLATRGAAPEAGADGTHYPGTYIAGCYNRLTSTVSGRQVDTEDLVNVPNWLPLTFRAPGEDWFSVDRAELLDYRQELNLRDGVLDRSFHMRDSAGRVTSVTQRRLVSMDEPHLAGLQVVFTAENWTGPLEVRSALDGRVVNRGVPRYRDLRGDHLRGLGTGPGETSDEVIWLQARTVTSGIPITLAARTRADVSVTKLRLNREDRWIGADLLLDVREGVPVTVEKVAAVSTSDDLEATRGAALSAPGFTGLLERHRAAWHDLWRRADTEIHVPGSQRDLRLHAFHLLQTVSPHTARLDAGVPARGLHGEAYHGNVFWDELFVIGWLNLRFPEIARSLLRYRWRRLPQARRAAREAGRTGAMFPWRGGSGGREETPPLHLNPVSGRWFPDNSHLQRHVGLAIAYNVWRHYEATGSAEFLAEFGAALMVEISRFFAGLTVRTSDGRYDIRGVMGPDEYHDAYPGAAEPGLNTNAYTNVLTVWVLRRTIDALAALPDHVRVRLAPAEQELERWREISGRLRVVFHADGVISQFDGYEDLAELDWARYRGAHRLDRVLEAENDSPNRYKAAKQADVLMLFYLLSAGELREVFAGLGYPFDAETINRTVRYYRARTAHGSTLSAVVHAWVLARNDRKASWEFFREALSSDVEDVQGGTTAEGVHLGAMAGTLDLVQRCYMGIEFHGTAIGLNPLLPRELPSMSLTMRYRGQDLSIRIRPHCTESGAR